MLIDERAAERIVKSYLPEGMIQAVVEYRDLFIFQVFHVDPEEGDQDPFFSVNKNTGEFRDFSIITDGDTTEIVNLFMAKKGG